MISVCMLGGAGTPTSAVAKYYLSPGLACGLAYYTEHEQLPGRWLAGGADALSLTGRLGPDGAVRLEQLLNGQGPDGQVLARPVWRADPAGRLPTGPLLTALERVAEQRGLPLDQLLPDPADRATVLGLVRRTTTAATVTDRGERVATGATAMATHLRRSEATITQDPPDPEVLAAASRKLLESVTVDAAVAGRLATAAGLDPLELYRATDGTDRYTPALTRAGGRVDVRRVGIDVTVSAPKSVSVLLALADPGTAALIEACHDRAVAQALGYLQRHAAHGLRGHHAEGQVMDRIATEGWITAAFTHYTSRAGDP